MGSGEAGRGLTGAGLDCGTWLVGGGGVAGAISGGVSGLVASGLVSGLGSGREGDTTAGGAACNVRFLQPEAPSARAQSESPTIAVLRLGILESQR